MNGAPVEHAGGGRKTKLVDLSEVSLQELPHQPAEALAPYLTTLFSQVERPRYNIGNSPPGRVD
jgi:hypothetical protein